MDSFTFKMLEDVYTKQGVSNFEEHPLVGTENDSDELQYKRKKAFCYLIKKGFIEMDTDPLPNVLRVTIEGASYIEKRHYDEKIFRLQEQNTEIQASLKKCQMILVCCAIVQVACALLQFGK